MDDDKERDLREEAAFAVDAENCVVYWNEGAAALLGFDESQTLDRHLAELLTVWDMTGNRYPMGNESLHEMARRDEEIREFAIEIARSDGTPLPVLAAVEVIRPQSNGRHQLLFSLQPDRRKPRTDWDLQHMIRQEIANLEVAAESEGGSLAMTGGTPTLSKRQVEVLSLLSQGMQCEKIAEELTLSVSTVRRHVQNALERLDAHTQAEAVAKAIRLHLI